MEQWKTINGYPDYAISDAGNVKSIRYNRILKQSKSGNQYLYINLVCNKRKKTTAIHKLVIEHFGPDKISVGAVVDHKDKNIHNNHINNLEWVTIAENTIRGYGNQDKKIEAKELRTQGWTIKKKSDSYYLLKNHEGKRKIFLDSFLSE